MSFYCLAPKQQRNMERLVSTDNSGPPLPDGEIRVQWQLTQAQFEDMQKAFRIKYEQEHLNGRISAEEKARKLQPIDQNDEMAKELGFPIWIEGRAWENGEREMTVMTEAPLAWQEMEKKFPPYGVQLSDEDWDERVKIQKYKMEREMMVNEMMMVEAERARKVEEEKRRKAEEEQQNALNRAGPAGLLGAGGPGTGGPATGGPAIGGPGGA